MSLLSDSKMLEQPTLEYRAWLHRMGLLETDDIMLAVKYNYIKPRKW